VIPLSNRDFEKYLYTWAGFHGLKESTRVRCGHGVSGRGVKSDAHEQWCVGRRNDLIDHASLPVRNGDRLLIAFTFRPRSDELGYESYLHRVKTYADRLGITAYIPPTAEPIHSLYARDTTAVLYGARGLDLTPFAALHLGLSPDLDHATTALARVQAARRRSAAREREARAANPKPLSASATFRAAHGDRGGPVMSRILRLRIPQLGLGADSPISDLLCSGSGGGPR